MYSANCRTSGTAIAVDALAGGHRDYALYIRETAALHAEYKPETLFFGRLTYILTLKMVYLPNKIWPRRRPSYILSNGISHIQIDAAVWEI